MEFKGTKGEWTFSVTKKGHAKISGDSWSSFCKVYTTTDGSRDTRKETQANAQLISAAPDLLEALIKLTANAGLQKYVRDNQGTLLSESFNKAKQAIEKALK